MSGLAVIEVIGVGQIISVFLQFIKVLVEKWVKPGTDLHDPLIQFLAGLTGLVGYVLHAWTLAPMTGVIFWDQSGQGFLSGLSAIVTYHILTNTVPGNIVKQPIPFVPPTIIVPPGTDKGTIT